MNNIPEVQIINRALLITHIDVEREQIDRRQRATTQHLKEGWKSIPRQVGLRRPRHAVVVIHGIVEISRESE